MYLPSPLLVDRCSPIMLTVPCSEVDFAMVLSFTDLSRCPGYETWCNTGDNLNSTLADVLETGKDNNEPDLQAYLDALTSSLRAATCMEDVWSLDDDDVVKLLAANQNNLIHDTKVMLVSFLMSFSGRAPPVAYYVSPYFSELQGVACKVATDEIQLGFDEELEALLLASAVAYCVYNLEPTQEANLEPLVKEAMLKMTAVEAARGKDYVALPDVPEAATTWGTLCNVTAMVALQYLDTDKLPCDILTQSLDDQLPAKHMYTARLHAKNLNYEDAKKDYELALSLARRCRLHLEQVWILMDYSVVHMLSSPGAHSSSELQALLDECEGVMQTVRRWVPPVTKLLLDEDWQHIVTLRNSPESATRLHPLYSRGLRFSEDALAKLKSCGAVDCQNCILFYARQCAKCKTELCSMDCVEWHATRWCSGCGNDEAGSGV